MPKRRFYYEDDSIRITFKTFTDGTEGAFNVDKELTLPWYNTDLTVPEKLAHGTVKTYKFERTQVEDAPVNFNGRYFEVELDGTKLPTDLFRSLLLGEKKIIRKLENSDLSNLSTYGYTNLSIRDYEINCPNIVEVVFKGGTTNQVNYFGAQVSCEGLDTLKLQFRDIFEHAAENILIKEELNDLAYYDGYPDEPNVNQYKILIETAVSSNKLVFRDSVIYGWWDSSFDHSLMSFDVLCALVAFRSYPITITVNKLDLSGNAVAPQGMIRKANILKYMFELIKIHLETYTLREFNMNDVFQNDSDYPTALEINNDGVKFYHQAKEFEKGSTIYFHNIWMRAFEYDQWFTLKDSMFSSDPNNNLYEWLRDFSEFYFSRFGLTIEAGINPGSTPAEATFEMVPVGLDEVEGLEFNKNNAFGLEIKYDSRDRWLNFNAINTNNGEDIASILHTKQYDFSGEEYTVNAPFSIDVPAHSNYKIGRPNMAGFGFSGGYNPPYNIKKNNGLIARVPEEFRGNHLFSVQTSSVLGTTDFVPSQTYEVFTKVYHDYLVRTSATTNNSAIWYESSMLRDIFKDYMVQIVNYLTTDEKEFSRVFYNTVKGFQASNGYLNRLVLTYAQFLGRDRQSKITFELPIDVFFSRDDVKTILFETLAPQFSLDFEDLSKLDLSVLNEILPSKYYILDSKYIQTETKPVLEISAWGAED